MFVKPFPRAPFDRLDLSAATRHTCACLVHKHPSRSVNLLISVIDALGKTRPSPAKGESTIIYNPFPPSIDVLSCTFLSLWQLYCKDRIELSALFEEGRINPSLSSLPPDIQCPPFQRCVHLPFSRVDHPQLPQLVPQPSHTLLPLHLALIRSWVLWSEDFHFYHGSCIHSGTRHLSNGGGQEGKECLQPKLGAAACSRITPFRLHSPINVCVHTALPAK